MSSANDNDKVKMDLKEAEAKLASVQTKLNETTTKQSEAKAKADRSKGAAKTANQKIADNAQVEINQLQVQVNTLTETIASLRSAESAEKKSKGKKMSCLACKNKHFNGWNAILKHIETEKHQKNLTAPDLVALFRCGTCSADYSTLDDIKTHMNDSGHLAAVAKVPCDTCGITLNSEAQYTAHVQSKKHANKLNKPAPAPPAPVSSTPPATYRCPACNLTFSTESLLQHHNTTPEHATGQAAADAAKLGRKNKRKAQLEKKRASKKAKASGAEPSQEPKPTFSCEPCGKTFTSAKQQEAHNGSKPHLKKIEAANGASANPYANTQV
jgi:uncharacterized C2H2 Zn-finger protein